MAPPLARTPAEARLFLALLPCERCGATETGWEFGAMQTVDGTRLDSYVGDCRRCGNARDITFSVPAPDRPASPDDTRFGGPDPSQLLDAGRWLDVAGAAQTTSALNAPGRPDPREVLDDLGYALDAFREALKFIPPGFPEVPPNALFSAEGRRRLAEAPESLTRPWIEAQITTLTELIREHGGEAGTAVVEQPRFDHPEDVQRARRWLRRQLLGAARELFVAAEPVVEQDDGPREVGAGPDQEPGRYLCQVAVSVRGPEPGWDPAGAVRWGAQLLAEAGWEVFLGPRADGGRWEVSCRRDGFVCQATTTAGEALVRLSGQTPLFVLPPVDPEAAPGRGAPPGRGPGPAWQPATEQEELLQRAVRQDDRGAARRLVQEIPLFVPVVRHVEAAAHPTVEVDGMVYLAAYTSPDTVAHVLGPVAGHRQTSLRELVDWWPNPEWGLAVNAGTPAEVYLHPEELREW